MGPGAREGPGGHGGRGSPEPPPTTAAQPTPRLSPRKPNPHLPLTPRRQRAPACAASGCLWSSSPRVNARPYAAQGPLGGTTCTQAVFGGPPDGFGRSPNGFGPAVLNTPFDSCGGRVSILIPLPKPAPSGAHGRPMPAHAIEIHMYTSRSRRPPAAQAVRERQSRRRYELKASEHGLNARHGGLQTARCSLP